MPDSDIWWMRRALSLAARGLYSTDPNPRVGCVLVRGGKIVGEGWHVRAGTAHAEINALRQAGSAAAGATAYVTLEPCCHHGRTGPCTEALIKAGVTRVVSAMQDPNPRMSGQGLQILRNAGIQAEAGLLADAAAELNPGFVSRMSRGRPMVRCKIAASLDGRTAMASGESKWITGPQARADVQRLRARASAVVTGSGTVAADNPSLNVRLPGLCDRQPLRVLLDSRYKVPATNHFFGIESPVLVIGARAAPNAYTQALPQHVSVLSAGTASLGTGVDLDRTLSLLADQEVNEVHLEAGATLTGAFLAAGLVDEMVVYVAPVVMGDAARGMFQLPGLERMQDRIGLRTISSTTIGDDLKLVLRPA